MNKKYIIVFGYTPNALAHNVEMKMPEWQPIGGVALSDSSYMQAMVSVGKSDYFKWLREPKIENAHA